MSLPFIRRYRLVATSALLMPVLAAPLAAQDGEPPRDSVEVASGELSGNHGRLAINLAAGDANQQIGAATVAIGDLALTGQSVEQLNGTGPGADRTTDITIGAGALSNNTGMVSLNLTAGTRNQSANLASLAIGNNGAVSDQMLAQASAPMNPAASTDPAHSPANDTIDIDGTALAGNSGLVQLNVVGGEDNSSANTFALNISAGGEP